MDDAQIRTEIEELEDEERRLRGEEALAADAARGDVLERDRLRLGEIKSRLAQLWDLLRQREALRSAGGDPDDASMRDASTIDGYLG